MQLELILNLLQILKRERTSLPPINQAQFRVNTSPRTVDVDLEQNAQTFILVLLQVSSAASTVELR
eukprot:3767727-Amphidinium_carterae.1